MTYDLNLTGIKIGGDTIDRNTTLVLIVLIIAIVVIIAIFAWMWMYTPYMGGYHGYYGNNTGHGMMHGY